MSNEDKIRIPDLNPAEAHPILQTLASKDSWVRVVFYGPQSPTKAEIERTIELLCMMYNGWS
jgi:hypothetical protein